MLDVLIGLVLVALGYALGCSRKKETLPAPLPDGDEVRRLAEDRAAFTQLMGYNAQKAYGNGE